MAAITADKNLVTEARRGFQLTVADGVTMYAGSVAAVQKGSGTLAPNGGAAGDIIVGVTDGTPFFGTDLPPTAGGVKGDTSASDPPKFPIQRGLEGQVIENVAVTGTSALTNFGDKVYMNADDHTFTLTRPTRGQIVGFVLLWKTGTTCDVFFYSTPELLAIGYAGGGKREICLGLIDFASATNATLKTIVAAFHGKILSTLARPVIACTGSGGTVAVQPKIGGTALTTNGGLVTVSTAAGGTLGTNMAGAAVTDDGTNEFHEGDTITLVGSSAGGTQTSGLVEFIAIVENLPGA